MSNDDKTTDEAVLIVYGTNWCPGAVVARRYLKDQGIDFKWVDIDSDQEGREFVLEQTGGYASVPTLRLPDGEVLVEPSMWEIKRRFGSDDSESVGLLDRLLSLFGG